MRLSARTLRGTKRCRAGRARPQQSSPQEHEQERARLEAVSAELRAQLKLAQDRSRENKARTKNKEAAKTKSAREQFKKDIEVVRKRGVALRKKLRKEKKKAGK
eukprot:2457433-Pleurochrysis_carterae.AAC.2